MNFLKSLGGLVGANAATGGLPYVIDAPPPPSSSSSTDPSALSSSSSSSSATAAGIDCGAFLLFPGHAKSDATLLVSIFKSTSPTSSPPTQNALRRLKTLRHPNVLAFVDGIEAPNNGAIVLVTERVTPLPLYLEELRRQIDDQPNRQELFTQSVAWGLRSVLLALQFLTVDCKLLHGRIGPHSVFVTRGGDWKLGGFELTGEWTPGRGPSSVFTGLEATIATDTRFKSPEWQRRDWSAMTHAPGHALDVYGFAALLHYVFNDGGSATGSAMGRAMDTDLAAATNVPHALRVPYRKALDADATKRPTPATFLASGFFDTPFIQQMDFLENLAVKTPEEKAEFYKQLAAHLGALPRVFAVYKVLPALKGVVEFGAATGAGSGGSKNAPVVLKLDPSASHMLPAMVQIGSSLSPDEFKEQVLPVIVKLFSCNDRAVRVQLLQMMEKFAVHFDAKLVNSAVIFDNLCSGFTDAAPVLRELTVKSMLHIADKLSDANLNTRVMKYFAKLQTDPEPAIRTNTTICLGRIAPKLNDATRPKVLFPAFSRALRDPFPHARLAGLRSLTACEEFFTPQVMASSVVPVIAPLLLDVSISVREQASLSMDVFMKKVMDEAVEMKVREAQQAQEQKLRHESGGDVASAAGASSATAAAAPAPSSGVVSVAVAGSSYAASLTSWAASAVVSNVGKMVSGSGSHSTPPTSSSSSAATASQQHQQQPTSSSFSSHSGSSAFTASAPGAASSSSAFAAAAADDFGADEDAWGDDDELDGFGSPKAPTQSAFTSSSASRTGSSSSSSSSSMKLTTATRHTTGASSSSSSSAFAMGSTDGGWGDDNWGGDDDLGVGAHSSTSATAAPASSLRVGATSSSSSLQLGNAGSRNSSFGSSSTSGAGSRTTSFGTAAPVPAASSSFFTTTTATASAASSSGASSVRKPVSERMAEAKAKRESLGAMKLETAKKGDEWDNWDF